MFIYSVLKSLQTSDTTVYIKKIAMYKELQYIHANSRQLPIQSFIQLTKVKAYVKPILNMYALQSLQEQISGFHFLILLLKTLKFDKFYNYQEEYPR